MIIVKLENAQDLTIIETFILRYHGPLEKYRGFINNIRHMLGECPIIFVRLGSDNIKGFDDVGWNRGWSKLWGCENWITPHHLKFFYLGDE